MALLRSLEQLSLNLLHHDHHLALGTLAVGAVSSLYTHEKTATRAEKSLLDTGPKVVSRRSDRGDSVFIFRVGLMQDPQRFGDRLGPHLDALGPSYFMKSSVNDQANKEAQLKILEQEAGRRVVIFGNSKGGKDEVHEMADPDYMAEHARIDKLYLDSTPFDRSHIRWRGRAMLLGASFLPDTRMAAALFARKMQKEALRHGERFVKGLSSASFYETQSEIPLLLQDLPANESIAAGLSPENVQEITMLSSSYDSMVNMQRSHAWLVDATNRTDIQLKIDEVREDGSHAGVTDHPEYLVRELTQYVTGDYDRDLQTAA
jgi:hypothetical protein